VSWDVQEALTNTLKHAGAQRCIVHLRFRVDRLEIEVTDDGSGGSTEGGAGLGLIGMRERVDVLGGTLVTSPRKGGGFTVRATLPLMRRERGKENGDDPGAAGR
jgi:signal transduction histidine kinase